MNHDTLHHHRRGGPNRPEQPPRPACINMVEQIFAREPWTVTH
jgi:hypothetical protein